MPKGLLALLVAAVLGLIGYFAYIALQPEPSVQQTSSSAIPSRGYVPPAPITQNTNFIPVMVVDLAADQQFDQANILSGRAVILLLHGGEVSDRLNHQQDVYNAYQILSILTQGNSSIIDLNTVLFIRLEFLHYLGGGARVQYVSAAEAGLRALTFSEVSLPQAGVQSVGTVITAVFADGSRRQVKIVPFDATLLR